MLVVGSTGYIGKFVTKELIARGFNVVAFAREQSGVGGKARREDTEKVPLRITPVHATVRYLCNTPVPLLMWYIIDGSMCTVGTHPPHRFLPQLQVSKQAGLVCVQEFAGADVRFGDVQDMESLRAVGFSEPVDVVVSCLASRTGGKVRGRGALKHAAWCMRKRGAGCCMQEWHAGDVQAFRGLLDKCY